MIFPFDPPAVLPKLALFVTVVSDLDDAPRRFTITLYGPAARTELFKTEHGRQDEAASIIEGATRFHAKVAIPLANCVLSGPGKREVIVQTERESMRAGWLTVTFPTAPVPDTVASQPLT